MQNKNYISVLKQGLVKKIHILEQLMEKNVRQRELLADPELEPEEFEASINEKAALIDELTAIDDGFEQVYERVRDEIQKHRNDYAADISQMQQYIAEIMEKSTQVQTEEQRNRELILKKFADVKKQIREVKSGKKAVDQYYHNMMKLNYVEPQFMDNKK
jgi:flagellar biosynthesis/type III secretory pathway chaperone